MLGDFFKKTVDGLVSVFGFRNHEDFSGFRIKGEIFWRLTDSKSGKSLNGHLDNIVTLDASILLARLLKGPGTGVIHSSEPNFGAFALAVGTGDIAWNPLNPPAGTNTQRSLSNEIARKAIQSTSFISSGGLISSVPTNIIDLTTTFVESEAVGAIDEMGILGGDISTTMAVRNPVLPPNGSYDPTVNLIGKDTLINYVTFPVLNKPATSTLSWVWRLSL